jgi:hypothetical protein
VIKMVVLLVDYAKCVSHLHFVRIVSDLFFISLIC